MLSTVNDNLLAIFVGDKELVIATHFLAIVEGVTFAVFLALAFRVLKVDINLLVKIVVLCVQIFCGECSEYMAPLAYKGSKMCRVCQTCYEHLEGPVGMLLVGFSILDVYWVDSSHIHAHTMQ